MTPWFEFPLNRMALFLPRILGAAVIIVGILSNAAFPQKTMTLKTPMGGDFTLPIYGGKLRTQDLRGKNLFIYFGFSRCSDVCPLTLRNFAQAFKQLSKAEQKLVRVIFISVDNERDNLAGLKKYVEIFGENFTAGTASDSELNAIAEKFGARFARFKTRSGSLLVDHTDSVFVINRAGVWTHTLAQNSTTQQIVKTLHDSNLISEEQAYKDKRSRNVVMLGENANCDLGVSDCKIQLSDNFGDQGYMSFSISPKPVRVAKDLAIIIKTNSKTLRPSEIDFIGLYRNMGYIRPKLNKIDSETYSVDIKFPICDLKKMKWQANLLTKDSLGFDSSFLFNLETSD